MSVLVANEVCRDQCTLAFGVLWDTSTADDAPYASGRLQSHAVLFGSQARSGLIVNLALAEFLVSGLNTVFCFVSVFCFLKKRRICNDQI